MTRGTIEATTTIVATILLGMLAGPAARAAPRAAVELRQAQDGRAAQPAPPTGKRAVAQPVVGAAPEVDGRLDDAAWTRAGAATGFVQLEPEPGEASERRTEARVVYDADAVYVAMRMHDSADSVVTQLARRDASGLFTDWAHVVLDSYHDRRTAFRFSVTPSGTQKDVLHFEDSREDVNWDAVWESAARIDERGWTAEFRIPLSQLRFTTEVNGAGELVWGVNFGREIARSGERSWWSPVLPDAGGFVSEAGELYGLTGLESPNRLELVPYTLGSLTRAPADPGNPFYDSSELFGSLGADLKYGLTSNLTLSATINPDFGQVEADPSVVNLSAFETFYPEKRPFFTEGSNVFDFGIGFDDGSGESLFYSRRIGRRPQRTVESDGWVESPDATTILGAAKLSGRTAGGWTLGFLDAVTGAERARTAAPNGAAGTEPVEPLTNYTVGSLSRDFREGASSLGLLLTAANRRLDEGGVFGSLPSSAYAAGLRGRHRFADDEWEASAYVAGSRVLGGEDAIAGLQRSPARYYQRPDAGHVEYDPSRTSLAGAAANVGLWKIGGGSLRGGVGGHLRTPGFEVNDLGYQRESDMSLLFANARWQQSEPVGVFRSFTIGLNPSAGWSTGGEHQWAQLGSFANFQLRSFWNGGWWIGRRLRALNTAALRGGPAIVRPAGINASTWLNTDNRRAVVGHLNAWGGREDGTGTWNYGIGTGVTIRPSSRLNLSLRPTLNRNHDMWQYVAQPTDEETGEAHYVFGELDQTTASLTTRLNLTLSPTLSFELYAQPFVSGADYTGFKEVADPRADEFEARFAPYGDRLRYEDGRYRADADGDGSADVAFRDPDFGFRQMRGNAVLRWEYTPGSTLYLVWNQSRTAALAGGRGGDVFDLSRDLGRLFNRSAAYPTPVTNVLMVKMDYWLNF